MLVTYGSNSLSVGSQYYVQQFKKNIISNLFLCFEKPFVDVSFWSEIEDFYLVL